jgi:hypothetical protein
MLLLAFVLPAVFGAFTTVVIAPPAWLEVRPGQMARVAEAPWFLGDKPQGALTASEASAAAIDPDNGTKAPADALGTPVGLRVRIARLFTDHVALVQDAQGHSAYVRIELLVPEVPAATQLVVAGDDGDSADFYPLLTTTYKDSLDIAPGSRVTTLGMGVAPYERAGGDFVRTQVKVETGELRGKTGWIAPKYLGLPGVLGPASPETDRACGCRPLEFR